MMPFSTLRTLAPTMMIAAAALIAGKALAQDAPAIPLSADEPIAAADLHAALFAWADQPVVVGGYLEGTMSYKSITSMARLVAAPGEAAVLAECVMAGSPSERVRDDPPVIFKGTFNLVTTDGPNGGPKVQIKDCEIVSIGEAFDETAPAAIGTQTPVSVAALHEAAAAWYGREISVSGYFHGNTHSSATDTTRVDLRPDQSGSVLVGCNIPGNDVVPQSVVEDREGVVMRGTLGIPVNGRVVLENCSFVNRS